MGKCPYCSKELHIEDFYSSFKEKKKGEIIAHDFLGENVNYRYTKMWVCPSCDTILGFTERGP